MKIQHLGVGLLLCVGAAGCGGGMAFGTGSNKAPEGFETFEGPVPRAICGADDKVETGIQGRTRAVEDVASGRAAEGYQCNLELVGTEGSAALWQMAWYEDCAYYGIGIGTAGVAVVDVSDPTHPVRTQTLTTPAMLDPWESLKVNEKRGLLAAVGPSLQGPVAFDVYDIKENPLGGCAQPFPLSLAPVNTIGHEGEWAPDGLTYYSSALLAPTVTALDVTIPNAPIPIATMNENIHGLSLNDDGTRLYATETMPNGLEIWDVSAIQSRAPDAQATVLNTVVVGSVYWEDGAVAQMTIPVTIQGKPYVIFIDEGGGGMARIIDISDETAPFVVSKLKTEIDMPEAAELRATDGGASGFTYQGHYCGVPQREEPGVVACSYFWEGIRVFDIRDPYHPKEIAYFVPGGPALSNTSSAIRFVPERGEIWFTDQGHGLMVARFTNGAWPFPAER